MKKLKKISVGPEVVLSMRRGRIFTDRRKQSSKWACRKKGKIKAQEFVSWAFFIFFIMPIKNYYLNSYFIFVIIIV